jgi:SAM-dependent methyltransferase
MRGIGSSVRQVEPDVSEAFSTDPVAVQYEQWSFPQPCTDLTSLTFQSPGNHFKDLRELYWTYWPCAPYRENLDILVAGCGTAAAAAYAYLFPRARVVGIDVSAASLAHEDFLKRKHHLDNLMLRQCRIEDVESLGTAFDFINVHGVLHHLVDPVAGLRALGGTLRKEGVAAVMVYAPYGRAGVYMLQEFFRLLGLAQNAEGLRLVKETLRALGPDHPLQRYLRGGSDLSYDAGLVDTFLHARDQAYTVGKCLNLVDAAGLTFQGWDENTLYHPDARIPLNHVLHAPLSKLRDASLWQAMELLVGCLPLHFFHVCRRDRPQAHYRVCFEGDLFLSYMPVPRVTQTAPSDALTGKKASVARPPFPSLRMNDWQARLFSLINSQRTVRECLEDVGLDTAAADVVTSARDYFRLLWRVGYVAFRMPTAS